MEHKEGQISIFVILGIVLLLVFGFIVYIADIGSDEKTTLPEEFQPINNFVESCLKIVAENATWLLTRHGGDIEGLVFDRIPAISEMERELSEYVDENIDSCIKDFQVFKEQGFVIMADNHSVETRISQEDVGFVLTLPISVKKGDTLREIDKFAYNYEGVGLPYLRKTAMRILGDGEWIKRDLVLWQLREKDIQMDITSYDSYIVYVLKTDDVWFGFGERVG